MDEFGIPSVDEVSEMPLALLTESDSRLEKILRRKLTVTELSAAESMASEHASYGSTRYVLKTVLPVDGVNHVKGIGDEAAAALFYVGEDGSVVLVYSSESHNHPSFVCAAPGAGTGAGGNIRDNVASTGRKPELQCEARRQGDPIFNPHNDPIKQHTDETTRGIADYCNAMGIPHGDGSIKFDSHFAGNNLVNVMSVSVDEKARLLHNKVPETDAPERFVGIYIGKASDTTGLGGTKFASQAIDMTNTDLNEKAVQDPDPHLQEALVRGIEMLVDEAVREGWKDDISVKDMGAAGLLCSTVEQLHGHIGAVIYGDAVPQNEARTSTELLEAETQERFFLYAHESRAQRVLDIFNKELGLPFVNKGACARVVARCTGDGVYRFVRDGIVDVAVPVEDLVAGPLIPRKVREPKVRKEEVPIDRDEAVSLVLHSINFKSDGYVHDHYDKHVRGTNIVNRGQGCAVLRTHPLLQGKVGFSVSFDSNARYGLLDPMLQAEDSFVRGAYRMAAVGCSVIGCTNNANFGRTDVPEEMWAFVKAQEGIARACYNWPLEREYLDMVSKDPGFRKGDAHVTVNSGNCSMNKANANTGTAIPPTTILGLVGWTNAPHSYATWDLKPGSQKLFVVGRRQPVLGGSDYARLKGVIGDELFKIDYDVSEDEVYALIQAVRGGLVSAANLVEEGGLCNAVAEMVANTSHPVDCTVEPFWEDNEVCIRRLFSEAPGMVCQVSRDNEHYFRSLMEDCYAYCCEIGRTDDGEGRLEFEGLEAFPQSHIQDLYFNKLPNLLGGRI